VQRFVAPSDMGLFAHAALVRLLYLHKKGEEPINWRRYVGDTGVLRNIAGFKYAAMRALETGLVRYVLNPRPKSKPSILT
jgi:hypothetical protein